MKFRKKPITVEAIQFTGHNDIECMKFCPIATDPIDRVASLLIPTLEGIMKCNIGDWIIKGVKGELYPCKPDVFEATYEPVEATPPANHASE